MTSIPLCGSFCSGREDTFIGISMLPDSSRGYYREIGETLILPSGLLLSSVIIAHISSGP